jgi:hypothetical protein
MIEFHFLAFRLNPILVMKTKNQKAGSLKYAKNKIEQCGKFFHIAHRILLG